MSEILMTPIDVLNLMGEIAEKHKLSLEFAEDGRDAWPARWQALKAAMQTRLDSIASGQGDNPGSG